MTDASTSEHVHVWKPVAHVDACHYFMWSYACECGYVYETSQERDVAANSYSAIWMTNDDGSPMSPPPRLEMFARRDRLGWDTFGNESLGTVAA